MRALAIIISSTIENVVENIKLKVVLGFTKMDK